MPANPRPHYVCQQELEAERRQWAVLEVCSGRDIRRMATFGSEAEAQDTARHLNERGEQPAMPT